MKDFKLNRFNIGEFVKALFELVVDDKSFRVNIVAWRNKRSLSQNGLQHLIYGKVSKFLIAQGRKEWTPKKTKDSLKSKYLGWEDTEFVDVVTGEITIKTTLRATSDLDVGESFHYTTQIIEWCEWMDISIEIPATCEYRALQDLQNE